MSKKIEIYTVRGPEGAALVVNGTRVCGPKPWGGGRILDEFEVDKKELYEAFRKPPTKRQLWRRVARLAGEHLFEGRNYTTRRSIDRGTNIVWMLREFIKETKSSTAYLKRKWQRRIAKLEAALKAWEAAP